MFGVLFVVGVLLVDFFVGDGIVFFDCDLGSGLDIFCFIRSVRWM